MALFVALDYAGRRGTTCGRSRADPHAEARLTPWLRWQHTVLTVLFIGLVYTGFVHRFPDAFFSWPFKALAGGNAAARAPAPDLRVGVRRVLRRPPGARSSARRPGARYARALWFALGRPQGRDRRQLAFNLGLRRDRPPRRRWNYAEKAEYWALVWGSVVMVDHRASCWCSPRPCCDCWPKVCAGPRAGDPLLRGRAGDAGDRGVACLLGRLRPARVPDEPGVAHREEGEPRRACGPAHGARGAGGGRGRAPARTRTPTPYVKSPE